MKHKCNTVTLMSNFDGLMHHFERCKKEAKYKFKFLDEELNKEITIKCCEGHLLQTLGFLRGKKIIEKTVIGAKKSKEKVVFT